MLDLFTKDIPIVLEIILLLLGGFFTVLIIASVLVFIIFLLSYAKGWITDDFSDKHNALLKFVGQSVFPMYFTFLAVVFYKVGILLTIIGSIMYVARSGVRLKSALSSHIEDKKAHK